MKPVHRVKAPSRPMLTVVEFKREPDPDAISMLRGFIEAVERGEISGIAVAATRHGGGVTSAYVIGHSLFQLIGSVRNIEQRLVMEIGT
jgi:hypothetical protein